VIKIRAGPVQKVGTASLRAIEQARLQQAEMVASSTIQGELNRVRTSLIEIQADSELADVTEETTADQQEDRTATLPVQRSSRYYPTVKRRVLYQRERALIVCLSMMP